MSNQSIIRDTLFRTLPEDVRECIQEDVKSFSVVIQTSFDSKEAVEEKLSRLHKQFRALPFVPDELREVANRCHLSALLEPLAIKLFQQTGHRVFAKHIALFCPTLKSEIAVAFGDLPDHVCGPALLADEFTVRGPIGSGSEAQIFEARNYDGLIRALKITRNTEADKARLRNENTVINALNDESIGARCPFIIGPTHFREADDFIFLEMDKLNGQNLLGEITRKWSADNVAELGIQLCTAFQFIHKRGYFHADISAKNVLIEPASNGLPFRAVVIDFGLAVPANVGNRQIPSERNFGDGTPIYASPEQRKRMPLTASDECFSVGRLLAFVLTGEEHVSESTLTQSLLEQEAECPGLVTVLRKSIATETSDRFHSMKAMRDALVAYQATLQPKKIWRRAAFALIALSLLILTIYLINTRSLGDTNIDSSMKTAELQTAMARELAEISSRIDGPTSLEIVAAEKSVDLKEINRGDFKVSLVLDPTSTLGESCLEITFSDRVYPISGTCEFKIGDGPWRTPHRYSGNDALYAFRKDESGDVQVRLYSEGRYGREKVIGPFHYKLDYDYWKVRATEHSAEESKTEFDKSKLLRFDSRNHRWMIAEAYYDLFQFPHVAFIDKILFGTDPAHLNEIVEIRTFLESASRKERVFGAYRSSTDYEKAAMLLHEHAQNNFPGSCLEVRTVYTQLRFVDGSTSSVQKFSRDLAMWERPMNADLRDEIALVALEKAFVKQSNEVWRLNPKLPQKWEEAIMKIEYGHDPHDFKDAIYFGNTETQRLDRLTKKIYADRDVFLWRVVFRDQKVSRPVIGYTKRLDLFSGSKLPRIWTSNDNYEGYIEPSHVRRFAPPIKIFACDRKGETVFLLDGNQKFQAMHIDSGKLLFERIVPNDFSIICLSPIGGTLLVCQLLDANLQYELLDAENGQRITSWVAENAEHWGYDPHGDFLVAGWVPNGMQLFPNHVHLTPFYTTLRSAKTGDIIQGPGTKHPSQFIGSCGGKRYVTYNRPKDEIEIISVGRDNNAAASPKTFKVTTRSSPDVTIVSRDGSKLLVCDGHEHTVQVFDLLNMSRIYSCFSYNDNDGTVPIFTLDSKGLVVRDQTGLHVVDIDTGVHLLEFPRNKYDVARLSEEFKYVPRATPSQLCALRDPDNPTVAMSPQMKASSLDLARLGITSLGSEYIVRSQPIYGDLGAVIELISFKKRKIYRCRVPFGHQPIGHCVAADGAAVTGYSQDGIMWQWRIDDES
tara:strand:- start:2537 stop:6244 length:3708 start_codon:yes stop_codon:yes gene_type:complete